MCCRSNRLFVCAHSESLETNRVDSRCGREPLERGLAENEVECRMSAIRGT